MTVIFCDIDLHFQGQAFSCYAIIKNAQAADVPGRYVSTRTVEPPLWSGSC